MYSPLILQVRQSISSESFFVDLLTSSTLNIFVLGIQLSYYSPPHPFFFQVSSLDLSSRHIKSSRESWFPILALLWNSGKNWVRQRRDAVAKTGGSREGREGRDCRAKHEGEDGRGPQGKSSSTMLVMQDLIREEEDTATEVCVLPPPLGSRDGSSGGSRPRKPQISILREISTILVTFTILAASVSA